METPCKFITAKLLYNYNKTVFPITPVVCEQKIAHPNTNTQYRRVWLATTRDQINAVQEKDANTYKASTPDAPAYGNISTVATHDIIGSFSSDYEYDYDLRDLMACAEVVVAVVSVRMFL